MVHQHVDGGEKIVFIFPVGKQKEGMGTLNTQSRMLRLLQEVNYWVQRMDGVAISLAPVGRFALSGFSAGIRFLASVLMSAKNPRFFDNLLKEVYSFDGAFDVQVLGPDGKPTGRVVQSTSETVNFCSALKAWLVRGGAAGDRAIRVYTQRNLWFDQLKDVISGATSATGPENAKEVESPSSSVLFVPADNFWKSINTIFNGAVVHPTFKGVWSTVVNFAPLSLPDTSHNQSPGPHK
jgi:hypothetical protein